MAIVSFVSSGPGDPDLLTVKAVKRLQAAQVILYDDLSAGAILELASPKAELISVGKRAGKPSPKQEHINQLLVAYAHQAQSVVRLKSGDAGIFGRLEEEILALRAAGISYEIVPGVTACAAAAASAAIPLTRRIEARRVQFITGHDINGSLPADLNWPALTDPSAVTAVYMARGTAVALAETLISRGLPDDCPAMICIDASRPDEVTLRCTIGSLQQSFDSQIGHAGACLLLYGALMPE